MKVVIKQLGYTVTGRMHHAARRLEGDEDREGKGEVEE